MHPPVENLVPGPAEPVGPRFPRESPVVDSDVTVFHGDPQPELRLSPPDPERHHEAVDEVGPRSFQPESEGHVPNEANEQDEPNGADHGSELDPARSGPEFFAPRIPDDGSPVFTNDDLSQMREGHFSRSQPVHDGGEASAQHDVPHDEPPLKFTDEDLEEFKRIPSRGFQAAPGGSDETEEVSSSAVPVPFTNEDLEDGALYRGFGYGAEFSEATDVAPGENLPVPLTNEDLEQRQGAGFSVSPEAGGTGHPGQNWSPPTPSDDPPTYGQQGKAQPPKHMIRPSYGSLYHTHPDMVYREYTYWGDWPPLEPHVPGLLRGGEGGIRGDGYIPPRGRPQPVPPKHIIIEIPPPGPWMGHQPGHPDALDYSRSP